MTTRSVTVIANVCYVLTICLSLTVQVLSYLWSQLFYEIGAIVLILQKIKLTLWKIIKLCLLKYQHFPQILNLLKRNPKCQIVENQNTTFMTDIRMWLISVGN